jgi:phage tail-like protein
MTMVRTDPEDPTLPSAYLRYLPALYWKDVFMGRFLRIFEDILSPVQNAVNRLPDQFDATTASPEMLDMLADWVGADAQPSMSDQGWRRSVRTGMLLHRMRGTKDGLRLAIELATGHRPLITEFSPGLVLGEDASLGHNTSLQAGAPLTFMSLLRAVQRK